MVDNLFRRLMEANIDKRSGKTYGPTTGKMIFHIDDMNLPKLEEYGTQTPMALIRQHLDYCSWYDRTEIGLKKTIVDCQYIACMNQKNGSFFIDPRLQRHFVTFACDTPEESDLKIIYGTVLTNHLSSFDRRIQDMVSKLVDSTIAIHREIQLKLVPSAVKFYYVFTMRELSSVVRGLLNAKPSAYHEPTSISRLWYHEVMRVYSDRLLSDSDIQRCRDIAIHTGKRYLDDGFSETFAEPCIFTSFSVKDVDGTATYSACENLLTLKSDIEHQLSLYNESNPIMNLVLFDQAMQHVARICRIMFNGGSALFCGVGGSGKQSLSKLACFICGFHFVQLSMSNDYSLTNFKEDLRGLFHRATIKPAEPIMFLLNDDQILDERFLVCINDLLSSGRVADLFTPEEYDTIFAALRGAAKAEGIPDNRDSMMKFFTSRVRLNLRVVLCLSPVGDQFRQRARKFPGLFNCTTINWLHEWPKEALVSVAQKFLKGVVGGGDHPDFSDSIAYHVAEVHVSVGTASIEYLKSEKRYNYTTPKSFLELVNFYKSLLQKRQTDLSNSIRRLETGLDTLVRTNKDVMELQELLQLKKVEVEAKRAATDALLDEMGKQRSEAETQQELADKEKLKADQAADEARKLMEQAEDDLALAKPKLDAANDAIHCLDKSSMTELKSFNKLPAGVEKVTAALLIMIKLEKKDFSWENAKKMMAKLDTFKERLETYRGEDIPEEVVAKVMPFLLDTDFTFEKMKSKSSAAANLCNWVVNIINYNMVYKRVKPMMDSLDVAQKAKLRAEADLAVVEEALSVIEAKLNKLQGHFMVATQEKAVTELEAKHCSDRLHLAERLTTGLHSERERWIATVDGLRLREETLPGDVMLAAAFTSYLGAFSAPFRLSLWKDVWYQDLIRRDIPITQNVDPLQMLTDESIIAGWQNEGLPADRFSFENGAILDNCNRWPLLIDPQLQGIKWLKKHEELIAQQQKRELVVCQQSDPSLMNKLREAISNGSTIIIENIGETFDASLRSIVSKAVYRKGKTLYIKIGDTDVEYDSNFKLYLQTKLSSPHYKPEVFANCTLINFIVTRSGLEDQLLAVIVSEEEPALEKTKIELVQAFNTYKIQLKSLEDNLLERLANAPTDILGDIPLIEGLEATKETADEIVEAVERGKVAEVGINEAREVYRVVAGEAALLYFIMLQLCDVDHMYQYSLDSFTKFFLKALKQAAPETEGHSRVSNLQYMLRWTIYRWVVRGLFERHRLMFLTQLTVGLLQKDPNGEEWGYSSDALRFLLAGPRISGGEGGIEKSPVSWLSDTEWIACRGITSVGGFEKFSYDMEESSPRFLEWYQHATPELEKLPGDYRDLDKRAFLKLLVIRILRPDRMTAALKNFIAHYLSSGKEFLDCDSQLSKYKVLETSFEDSSSLVPLYFLLSPGADIASSIDRLAQKMGKVKGVDYHNISLGQGQEVVASERLEVGRDQGHWIFLDNVHLMPRWLSVLEKRLDEYALKGTHPDFRVLLSSDPSDSIPVAILNRCIKITSDPPTGLKPNLKQALASFSADAFNDLESRTRGILFGLCQFHAIMVERKKFGSKGFNMQYPFAIGDLVSSAAVLRNYMESAPTKIPWVDLRYIFGEIMYGGHIINDFDRLVSTTYLGIAQICALILSLQHLIMLILLTEFYMNDELLSDMSMIPFNTDLIQGFKAPSTSMNYDRILDHIEEDFSEETPSIFGLHPNAEIGYRTQEGSDLLRIILSLSSSSAGTGLDAQNQQQIIETTIQETLDGIRSANSNIDVDTIMANTDIGPFQNFLIQECSHMNLLIEHVVHSLVELEQGFKGELMMSEAMESLAASLFLERVPGTWELHAYPSMRTLGAWLLDLYKRIQQLLEWIAVPAELPRVVWISGLFNPQCFLTAVMQITSHAQALELDKLTLTTEVLKETLAEEITIAPRDGAYIIGLYLEGASWSKQAMLDTCRPKQLFFALPIINIKPLVLDKPMRNKYICPVYKTLQRGPTYVFSLQLRSGPEIGKWILAGVAAIMDVL
jgi:dynein heavy chain